MKRLSDMPQVPTWFLSQDRCRLFSFSVHNFSSKINVVTVCFLLAKRSNPGAAVRPSGLLAPRMLWPLDCFVSRAPRNDGWVAADPIDSVVIGRRLSMRKSGVADRVGSDW